MKKGENVNRRTKVFEWRNDETTTYAILSHRWIEKEGEDQEVSYEDMANLPKADEEERDEIRQRLGYRKIIDSCEQAKKDGYERLWIDTCCIDKRSSAELSEAINSMYRWYANSEVCYAHLHDVSEPSFPTERDEPKYSANGWPEWFSRGWTLQELIAPSVVQFFNEDWLYLGDKKSLANGLSDITRIPQDILENGFPTERPCVAQIMSWAADRITTREEDRAYSLLGLLDVNMPMLYGEGKRAFQRLQLEIIRTSNDQSIFAWDPEGKAPRISGSILADDPSLFCDCNDMETMELGRFTEYHRVRFTEEELHSIREERLGFSLVTNRGIQICLPLSPYPGSCSVFTASLACCFSRRPGSWGPVTIHLAQWKSNYYRYFPLPNQSAFSSEALQFKQVYLRYQDTSHHGVTFTIDDRTVSKNGFTCSGTYPSEPAGNKFTLTSTNPLFIRVYADSQAQCHFIVGFGQCFGQAWVHLGCLELFDSDVGSSWKDYHKKEHAKMLSMGPEHAQSMARAGFLHSMCKKHICFPESIWTLQTSCTMWESTGNWTAMVEVIPHPGCCNGPNTWHLYEINVSDFFLTWAAPALITHLKDHAVQNYDMQGLMIDTNQIFHPFVLVVDGINEFCSLSSKEIKASNSNFDDIFKSYGTSSWVTMATLLAITMEAFIVKETFLLTFRYLKTWTLHQGSTKYMMAETCLMCLVDM